MAKKRKARFDSLSTPGVKQDCSNYLVELVFLRRNHGRRLASKFWQQTQYKFKYRREIQACRRFIKKYGEPSVLYVALHNPYITTWTDFAKIEYLMQQRMEILQRRATSKDISPVKPESVKVNIDLRTTRTPTRKKRLLQRLRELNNES